VLRRGAETASKLVRGLNDTQRTEFERVGGALLPEVGRRMLNRVFTGDDMKDGWVIVHDGVYRYTVFQDGGSIVKSLIRNYLATIVWWQD
jgi:hypothetical protein